MTKRNVGESRKECPVDAEMSAKLKMGHSGLRALESLDLPGK